LAGRQAELVWQFCQADRQVGSALRQAGTAEKAVRQADRTDYGVRQGRS
jgi:hypothetical protein